LNLGDDIKKKVLWRFLKIITGKILGVFPEWLNPN